MEKQIPMFQSRLMHTCWSWAWHIRWMPHQSSITRLYSQSFVTRMFKDRCQGGLRVSNIVKGAEHEKKEMILCGKLFA